MSAPALGDGGEDALLELGGCVNDYAAGAHETPAVVRVPRAFRLFFLSNSMIGVGSESGGTGGSPGMSAAPSISLNSLATSSHSAGRRRN